MPAKDHLSPEQLQDHVNYHMERWPESYSTPDCADGNCFHASSGYFDTVKDHGHTGKLQAYEVPEDVHAQGHPTHFAVHVETSKGPYAVDLTHRQFDAKAPYPLIEPVAKFESRKTMKPFKRSDYDHENGWD